MKWNERTYPAGFVVCVCVAQCSWRSPTFPSRVTPSVVFVARRARKSGAYYKNVIGYRFEYFR